MNNIPLTVFTTLATVAGFWVLPWQIKPAGGAPALALMSWVVIMCLVVVVESTVPVWCDIATKLIFGASLAIPASVFCILYRLYLAIRFQDVRKHLHPFWMEVILCLGLPTLLMGLHCIFQDSRYTIFQGAGCFPSVYPSALAYVLLFIWPLLFGAVCVVYSGLILFIMHKNQYHLENVLFLSSIYSVNRFLRLLCFAVVMTLWSVAVGVLVLHDILNKGNMKSLSSLHHDFHTIENVPASVWKSEQQLHRLVELRWAWPAISLAFFISFAFAHDTRAQYRSAYEDLVSYIYFRRDQRLFQQQPASRSQGSLPIFISRSPTPDVSTSNVTMTTTTPDPIMVAASSPTLPKPHFGPPFTIHRYHRSDSLLSIPSIITEESASYTPSVSESNSASSTAFTESSNSSFITCKTEQTAIHNH